MRFLIFLYLAFASMNINAQQKYPVKGVFKQINLSGGGQRIDAPQILHRCFYGKYSLFVFWDRTTPEGTLLSWRVEEGPNPEDPFSSRFDLKSTDLHVFTWYNKRRVFWSFPSKIWIDEEWSRVKNDTLVDALSDALVHHNAPKTNGKLQGTWKLVSFMIPDTTDNHQQYPSIDTYKIYGKEHCLMMQGHSIYDIEGGMYAMLSNFKKVTDTEFYEGGVRCTVTFETKNKVIVEYTNKNNRQCIETWIRYSMPNPLAKLFSSFK
ncbi:MAG: hypothetical protein MJZ69_11340 [Bacteroidaceae bacterium]|nr:hypothetical protein [Bacteroidaceae bacterium]